MQSGAEKLKHRGKTIQHESQHFSELQEKAAGAEFTQQFKHD